MLAIFDYLMQYYVESIQESSFYELNRFLSIKCCTNFPPQFKPEEWQKVFKYTNCFAYAINLNQKSRCIFEYTPYYLPQSKSTDKINYISNIFSKLGIPNKKIDLPVNSTLEHYSIGLFYSQKRDDIHFIRRDADNSWSHQMYWNLLPEQLGTNLSEIIEKLRKETYQLCCFYEIHKCIPLSRG